MLNKNHQKLNDNNTIIYYLTLKRFLKSNFTTHKAVIVLIHNLDLCSETNFPGIENATSMLVELLR